MWLLKKIVSKSNHYCKKCLCLIPKNNFCYADINYKNHFCIECYDYLKKMIDVKELMA